MAAVSMARMSSEPIQGGLSRAIQATAAHQQARLRTAPARPAIRAKTFGTRMPASPQSDPSPLAREGEGGRLADESPAAGLIHGLSARVHRQLLVDLLHVGRDGMR